MSVERKVTQPESFLSHSLTLPLDASSPCLLIDAAECSRKRFDIDVMPGFTRGSRRVLR